MEINQVEFYDDYIENQIKTSFNERQFSLIKKTEPFLSSKPNKILEIGCGIGIMSFLLSKKFPNSKITSFDISPASISLAKKFNTHSRNINFFCYNFIEEDVLPFGDQKFDAILIYDVLEHIPHIKHELLFEKIRHLSAQGARLIINIPNFQYIDSLKKTNPSMLQIVDESVFPEEICNYARLNDFHLRYFESYAVWYKNEYCFFVFEMQQHYHEIKSKIKMNFLTLIKRKYYYKKLLKMQGSKSGIT